MAADGKSLCENSAPTSERPMFWWLPNGGALHVANMCCPRGCKLPFSNRLVKSAVTGVDCTPSLRQGDLRPSAVNRRHCGDALAPSPGNSWRATADHRRAAVARFLGIRARALPRAVGQRLQPDRLHLHADDAEARNRGGLDQRSTFRAGGLPRAIPQLRRPTYFARIDSA